MKVFHGSIIEIKSPLVNVGRKHLDFGQGFYVTNLKDQAISWATRPINRSQTRILNVYELDLEQIKTAGFKYKHFKAYDSEWLDFVVSNRRGEDLWKAFDIIEGGIANDRVFNTIELYAAGLIPQEETLRRLRYEQPNNQTCILRQSIIEKHLTFIEAVPI